MFFFNSASSNNTFYSLYINFLPLLKNKSYLNLGICYNYNLKKNRMYNVDIGYCYKIKMNKINSDLFLSVGPSVGLGKNDNEGGMFILLFLSSRFQYRISRLFYCGFELKDYDIVILSPSFYFGMNFFK